MSGKSQVKNYKVNKDSITVPKESSNSLCERLGLITFYDAGVPLYSPIATVYLNTLSDFIMGHIVASGFKEFRLPILQNKTPWKSSGRYTAYKGKMESGDYVLSATAEEYAFWYMSGLFRDRPQKEYRYVQHGWKFRNELRSKGLLRTREFYMSDAYSLHDNLGSLYDTLRVVIETYRKIFDAAGLRYLIVASDGSEMGDGISFEFVVPHSLGEGRYVFNKTKVESFDSQGHEYTGTGRCFKGIEIAEVFSLGQKYPRMFDIREGDVYYHSGSYGIGISRLMEVLCMKNKGLDWGFLDNKPFDFVYVSNGSVTDEELVRETLACASKVYWTICYDRHINVNFAFVRKYFVGCDLLFRTRKNHWVYHNHRTGEERSSVVLGDLIDRL